MKSYLGAAIGNCVHVGGIVNFLRLVENEGNNTNFLGAAVDIDILIESTLRLDPDVICVGFRLTPESVIPLLNLLEIRINENELKKKQWIFGGTKPVAMIAREYVYFQKIFDGTEDLDDVISYLRGENIKQVTEKHPQNIIERINRKYPYPVIRHHFGLPSLEETIEGIRKISEEKVLDIISVGPDQNAQENFFNPDRMKHELDGAGGVPLRTINDFEKLYESSKTGNYPLLRCYSGTAEVFRFAELLKNTINNADRKTHV